MGFPASIWLGLLAFAAPFATVATWLAVPGAVVLLFAVASVLVGVSDRIRFSVVLLGIPHFPDGRHAVAWYVELPARVVVLEVGVHLLHDAYLPRLPLGVDVAYELRLDFWFG